MIKGRGRVGAVKSDGSGWISLSARQRRKLLLTLGDIVKSIRKVYSLVLEHYLLIQARPLTSIYRWDSYFSHGRKCAGLEAQSKAIYRSSRLVINAGFCRFPELFKKRNNKVRRLEGDVWCSDCLGKVSVGT